ncbi:hypothetical protein [Nocardioides nanhaiensis]|uniref:Uncharacterized protein n=1 Tax=Nocardioides nanhaiensis TaxID=1476871 RepID=A0ABP8X544_9ACTN
MLALVLGTSWLVGCGAEEEPFADYCAEVQEQQEPLSEALAGDGATALLAALPSFEALAAASPPDIADEWRTLLDAVGALRTALEEAGVDPASYDRADPPPGLAQADRDRIDAAARGLTRPATIAALAGVQQQARDVCKTPLSL